jgi:hypothetical protein
LAAATDPLWQDEPLFKAEIAQEKALADEKAAIQMREAAEAAKAKAEELAAAAATMPDWMRERRETKRDAKPDKAEDKAPKSPTPPPPPQDDNDGEDDGERNEDGYPAQGKGRSGGNGKNTSEGGSGAGSQEDFYIYEDARDRYYLGVKRTTNKVFPQYHWDGTQWIPKLPKGFLKIPFRLPELLDAPGDQWTVIAAGEKDALTAARLGFVATTNPGGEGKGQWTPELNPWFTGKKRVAIMEDNDKTGHAHVLEVARALRGIVPDIRIIQFRELSEHGDLTDWIEADRTRGYTELLARIESAKPAVGYELIKVSDIVPRAVLWIWPGHLACGELAILTGPPDLGKSQIHCFIVAVVTTGRDWPDGAKGPAKRKVVKNSQLGRSRLLVMALLSFLHFQSPVPGFVAVRLAYVLVLPRTIGHV